MQMAGCNSFDQKILADTFKSQGYISNAPKCGGLQGGPPHRPFLLDELKAATNSFDNSTLMGEGLTRKLKLYNENEDDEVNDHDMIKKERMKN
ncbi:hypothetical protein ACS0TY_027472 [Phlomoides rotata]